MKVYIITEQYRYLEDFTTINSVWDDEVKAKNHASRIKEINEYPTYE